jgi:hypothetical protein
MNGYKIRRPAYDFSELVHVDITRCVVWSRPYHKNSFHMPVPILQALQDQQFYMKKIVLRWRVISY